MHKKVNFQSKRNLAKLLAAENLRVIHDPKVPTAYMDVKNRVLGLPILKEMDGIVYDTFIAHEVAHALYTPVEMFKKIEELGIPKVFLNITEDARIEKLIKRKFPGTRHDFFQFYKRFSTGKEDFFKLREDLETYCLADRVNLHFKIGPFRTIKFNEAEQKIVDQTGDAETPEDAVAAAKALYDYMQDNPETDKHFDQEDDGEGECSCEDCGDGEDGQQGGADGNEGGEGGEGHSCNGKDGKEGKPPKKLCPKCQARKNRAGNPVTQGNFDKSFQENQILSNPNAKYRFGEVVDCNESIRFIKSKSPALENRNGVISRDYSKKYQTFFDRVNSTVGELFTRFNMKKSAHDFQRIQISKTGKLNVDEIAFYKVKDDIFLRSELYPDAKNHGMVMLIDWSSSMSCNISKTLHQVFILTEFCKKSAIPFEVYGFTTGDSGKATQQKGNLVYPNEGTYVFKIIDSLMKNSEYRTVINSLLVTGENAVCNMGSTPLHSAALVSEYIINRFNANFKVEKSIFILLSDGQPTDRLYVEETKQSNSNGKGDDTLIITKPGSFKNYQIDSFHDTFKYVKENCGVTKMIGFYITSQLPDGVLDPGKKFDDATKAKFKKDGYYVVSKGKAFDKFFAIDMDAFDILKEVPLVKSIPDSTQYPVDKIRQLMEAQLAGNRKKMLFLNMFIDEIS